jgi:tyrosinase
MAASPVFDTTYGFGGNGRGPGNCVADGPFAGATLVMGLDGKRVEEYCLARSFNDDLFSWTAQPNVDQCLNEPNYLDFWHCLENWIHTGPHQAMGGTVSDRRTKATRPALVGFCSCC